MLWTDSLQAFTHRHPTVFDFHQLICDVSQCSVLDPPFLQLMITTLELIIRLVEVQAIYVMAGWPKKTYHQSTVPCRVVLPDKTIEVDLKVPEVATITGAISYGDPPRTLFDAGWFKLGHRQAL